MLFPVLCSILLNIVSSNLLNVGSSGLGRTISNQVGCCDPNLGNVLLNVLKTTEFLQAHVLSLESGRL